MTIFKNANVIDGTGSELFRANVFVENKKIVKISQNCPADNNARIIDCTGKILCPGFMDIHSHSELEVLRNPSMSHKVQQGITFDLSGNCGVGVWPRTIDGEKSFSDILGHCDSWYWTDFASYAEKVKCGINMGFLQNHASLRKMAIEGNPNRKATDKEIEKMCAMLDTSLCQGCFGLSSGLYYAPNIFADRTEIIKLLEVVKKHNGLFAVHHRCEGNEIISSIQEVLSYVRQTGVRLEISHLKTIGKANASKAGEVLALIHQMKDEGFEIGFDQYPYEYGSTSLFSLLPPSYLRLEQKEMLSALKEASENEDKKQALIKEIENPKGWDSIIQMCGFDNITAVILESSPAYNGLKLTQCAEKMGKDCYTTLFTLLSRENKCALMTDITQSRETIEMIMSDPLMCFGTDSLYAGSGAHPRSGNAAIHLLDEYVKKGCTKGKSLTYEQAIRKMTLEVAIRLGITDRGKIAEDFHADIVVFDPANISDNSTPSNPYEICSGLEYVMVNGTFALKAGKFTGSTSGNIIHA